MISFLTTPSQFPSIVDQLVEQIVNRILAGDYAPGSKVTEEKIAADFGASRTPVREAIRTIADFGLILIKPRRGLEIASVTEEDLLQINVLREELETLALTLALKNVSAEQLLELYTLCSECDRLSDSENRIELFRADSAFHLAIARFSGNAYLYEALLRLDPKVQLCRMVLCLSKEKIRENIKCHCEILRTIKDNDTEKAKKILREHIHASRG
jgi:GntR family transcriptional regulator, rspAB operon transcriptional repressor